MDHAARRQVIVNIPNLLTFARIAAVPALVLCLFFVDGHTGRWLALTIFVLAGLTDWLDGYLARAWSQQSNLGRMLDPIADKLLVGATLMLLVYDRTIDGVSIFAAVTVLCREILVSGLREFLAELNVKVRVSWLAKWKTGFQMVALATLIAGDAGEMLIPGLNRIGLTFLWLAAVLTLWTGYDYLRAAVGSAVGEDPNRL